MLAINIYIYIEREWVHLVWFTKVTRVIRITDQQSGCPLRIYEVKSFYIHNVHKYIHIYNYTR